MSLKQYELKKGLSKPGNSDVLLKYSALIKQDVLNS